MRTLQRARERHALAGHDLYRVHWSRKILDETTKNLIERGKMNKDQAAHLVSEMAKAFPEAMIEVPQQQIDAMRNDPKDRHVAACAVCAAAEVICTINVEILNPIRCSSGISKHSTRHGDKVVGANELPEVRKWMR